VDEQVGYECTMDQVQCARNDVAAMPGAGRRCVIVIRHAAAFSLRE